MTLCIRTLERDFSIGLLHEDDVKHAGETLLLYNVDNVKVWGFKGNIEVRHEGMDLVGMEL